MLSYAGANTVLVNERLAALVAPLSSVWRALEDARASDDDPYTQADAAARRHDRRTDWIRAADAARRIVDDAEIVEYPALSIYAVGAARLSIAAEVLADVLDDAIIARLRALVPTVLVAAA